MSATLLAILAFASGALAAAGGLWLLRSRRQTVREIDSTLREARNIASLQKALQSSHARFSALAASPLLGVFQCDQAGAILFAGPRLSEICGAPAAALLGRFWIEAAHGSGSELLEAWNEIRRSRHAGVIEGEFGRGEATRRLRVQLAPILNDGNEGFIAAAEDVTTRHRTEAALRDSEERLQRVFQLMPDMVAITRLSDGKFVEVNAAWEHRMGWSRAEAIGRNSLELGIWKSAAERDSMVNALLSAGELHGMVLNLRVRDGSRLPLQLHTRKVELGGEPMLLSVIRDLTESERLRAEAEAANAARQRSDLMFSRAFEANPDYVSITRIADGRILHANESFERVTGWLCREAIGRTTQELGIWSRAEERSRLLDMLGAQKVVRDFPATLLRRNGSPRQVLMNAAVFEIDGDDCLLAIVRDVTDQAAAERALRESEERFQAFFSMAPIPLVVSRADGEYLAVNRAWSNTYGWSEQEVVGRHSPDFVPNQFVEAEDRVRLYAELRTSGHIEGMEVRVRRKNGTRVPVSMHAATARIDGQELILWSIEDVTRLRDAQHRISELNSALRERVEARTRELNQAVDNLDQAQKELMRSAQLSALGALMATLTHELNTPIGNSRIAATTLQEQTRAFMQTVNNGALRRSKLEAFARDANDAADLTLRSLERASELVGSFKQVAADQSSNLRRPFELAPLIEDILVTLQPSLRRGAYETVCKLAPGLAMDSFPGALGQVLSNLITNSMTHGLENGHGRITIEATAAGPEHVRISVLDDGCGIAPEHLPLIFDRFFTTKLGRGGTGLGLHIVRDMITHRLGGEIAVNSTLGHGAQFVITLPRRAPAENGHSSPADTQP